MQPARLEFSIFEPPTVNPRRVRPLTDQTFGRLQVVSIHSRAKSGSVNWICRCECGKWVTIFGPNLTSPSRATRSCGCLFVEGRDRTRHGDWATPEYRAYQQAKSRCTNSKVKNYDRYGGRGIEFRFASYEEFIAHIGRRTSERHSLDRINNDGHYELGNVRWSTASEQQNNIARNQRLTLNGITLTISRWSETTGIGVTTIANRLRRGWSVEKALSTPSRAYGK